MGSTEGGPARVAGAPSWVPQDVPVDRPSVARMYDYYLGGHHNFAVDRKAAEGAISIWLDLPLVMQANRAFLRRTVQFLAGQGIEQFLDLGSGIPTAGNVHEVAQQANPAARVVYVDVDPVAVAHGRALLKDDPQTIAVQADVRRPDDILDQAEVKRLLSWDRPVAVLLLAVLHFIPDDAEAYDVVRRLRRATSPGSFLVISHATNENIPADVHAQMTRLYSRTSSQLVGRTRDQIARYFDGLEMVEPGLVYLPRWHPEATRICSWTSRSGRSPWGVSGGCPAAPGSRGGR